MVRIGTCPVCSQPVSIPSELLPECLVRCPTCEAEYPLQEVPMEAESSDRPEPQTPLEFLKRLEQQAYGTQEAPAPPELIPVAVPESGEPGSPEAEKDLELAEQLSLQTQEGPLPAEQPFLASQEETELLLEEASQEQQEGLSGSEPVEVTPAQEAAMEEDIILAEIAETAPQAELSEAEGRPGLEEAAVEAPVQEAEIVAEEVPGEVFQPPPAELPAEQPSLSAEAVPAGLAEATAEAASAEAPPTEAVSEVYAPVPAEQPPTEAAPEEAPQEAPPLDLDPLVRSPLSDQAFPLSQLIVAATGEPIGPVAAAMIVRHGLLRPLTEEEAAAMAPPSAPAAEQPTETFDFSQLAAAGAEGAPAVPIAARPRRRPQVSPVKEFIGIVLGGVMGLVIGYYLLNIFWEDRYNFLKIYLPGIPHTYKYAPSWVPAWAKGGDGSTEAGQKSAPPESPQNNKNNKGQAAPKAKLPAAGSSPSAQAPPTGEKQPPSGEEKQEAEKQPVSPSVGPSDKPPAAKPKAKPSAKSASAAKPAKFQVVGAPSYSAQDLAQSLESLQEVFGCKQCNSTGKQTKTVTQTQQVDGQSKEVSTEVTVECEACKGKPPTAITEESFDRFCRLGEVLCFQTSPEDKNVQDRRLAARNLLERAAHQPGNLEKIAQLAAARWSDAGRLSMGLLAAGTLGLSKQQGPWQHYELHLAGSDRKIPVLVATTPPVQPGDRVLVLGAIVEDPAASLQGYSGNEPALLLGVEIGKVP